MTFWLLISSYHPPQQSHFDFGFGGGGFGGGGGVTFHGLAGGTSPDFIVVPPFLLLA